MSVEIQGDKCYSDLGERTTLDSAAYFQRCHFNKQNGGKSGYGTDQRIKQTREGSN